MTQPLPTPPPAYGPPPPGYGPAAGYGRPGYPAPAPPPVAPDGQPLAGFGDRVLAYLIDYAILSAVTAILMVPAVIYQFSVMSRWAAELTEKYDATSPPPDEFFADYFAMLAKLIPVYLGLIAAVLLITYVYRVELMFRTGQTIGKRVMKLRVVPLAPSDGRTLTRGMAVRRWLVDSVGAQLVPFLFFLDGLWQLWDQPYRQCLHDKLAGTIVIKVAPWQ